MSRRSDVAQEDTEQEDEFGLNTVMLFGSLSSDAVLRELPSGEKIVNLEVTTSTLDGRISVPVTSKDTLLEDLCVGDEVFVTGVVKRRFFGQVPLCKAVPRCTPARSSPERKRHKFENWWVRPQTNLWTSHNSEF